MREGLVSRLAAAGMSPAAAAPKAELFVAAERALAASDSGSRGEPFRWFVPGRIEVLGKHTDYAGGRSLLCGVERGFCVVARGRADRAVRMADAVRGLEATLRLSPDPGDTPSGWTVYAAAVLRRIVRNFAGPLVGADIALASDLPRASGMSSSSALVVSIFTALAAVNRLEERPEYGGAIRSLEDLAGYLGCVENGYAFGTLSGDEGVGTFGGSEDHTAILCSRAGHLSRFSFCPVRAEGTIALSRDWTFVLAVSGVPSDKTGDAKERYNLASLSAAAVLELWNEATGRSDSTLAAAVRLASDAPDRIRDVLRYRRHPRFPPETLAKRFDQFFEESERLVPAAAEAFARADASALAGIVDRSQERAEHLLGNQIPETITLARSARNLGAFAASAFGGGFGGSVWALVRVSDAPAFRDAWEADYRGRFPAAADASRFFESGAGPGRVQID
ncbi:MAG TPA: galactokinase family protein [Thermoanaerobaculia bacterium]|nr:galactokinase family protein [Thermoanaerobaculia bacterium]